MFTAASTTALLTTAFSDIGTIVAVSLTAAVVGVIALMGLGFGIRKTQKHVTGKKF